MVLDRQTNFFLGKTTNNIFWQTIWPNSKKMDFLSSLGKIGFSIQNHLFPKKSGFFGPKPSFSWEKIGFSTQNHVFDRKKLVFRPKTIFFLVKSWFRREKPFFSSGKPNKPCNLPQKMFFLFFWFSLGKIWFSGPKVFSAKTILFLGKVGFSRQNHIFPRKAKKHFF